MKIFNNHKFLAIVLMLLGTVGLFTNAATVTVLTTWLGINLLLEKD